MPPLHLAVHAASVLAALTAPVLPPLAFEDLAPQAGVDALGFGRGAAMVDLDGDGLHDLVACNAGQANRFFRQRPDHTFEDASQAWGIGHPVQDSWGVLAADFDNDGDVDVYIVNGKHPGQANRVLRNDLATSGAFTDVTADSGDGVAASNNFGGTALDYDRDGLLDIFLTTLTLTEPCVLLRNEGGLVFSDVSAAAGIVHPGNSRHCSSGDFDNDGWMDVAVGNGSGPCFLYRNSGKGTFDEVAVRSGVASPDASFGMVLEDFDNDGWMDVYVPKYQLHSPFPSELYRNDGDGTFTDVTLTSGMTAQTDMGHNTGDLDADGYPDIYIGTGHPNFAFDDVLFLVRPDGAGGFALRDVSDVSGVTSNGPTRCHGLAFGDYDGDGFVDVYANNGGVPGLPATAQENALWHNLGNGRTWVALELVGTSSNRSAVGARAVAITSSGREVHRMLRVGTGFANTDSPLLHFGLGTDAGVERVEIAWPSGARQTLLYPAVGRVHRVLEH